MINVIELDIFHFVFWYAANICDLFEFEHLMGDKREILRQKQWTIRHLFWRTINEREREKQSFRFSVFFSTEFFFCTEYFHAAIYIFEWNKETNNKGARKKITNEQKNRQTKKEGIKRRTFFYWEEKKKSKYRDTLWLTANYNFRSESVYEPRKVNILLISFAIFFLFCFCFDPLRRQRKQRKG